MKVINTKTHGTLDYLVSLALILGPWLFNFNRNSAELWVPVILGASSLVYSLMTDYEMGITNKITMKTHLMLDTVSGLFLAASPWLFGFNDHVYAPHLIVGLMEVAIVALSSSEPYRRGTMKLT